MSEGVGTYIIPRLLYFLFHAIDSVGLQNRRSSVFVVNARGSGMFAGGGEGGGEGGADNGDCLWICATRHVLPNSGGQLVHTEKPGQGCDVDFANVHGDWVHHKWIRWIGGLWWIGTGWVCESGSLVRNQIWWVEE